MLFPAIQGKTLCLGRASLLRPQATGLSLAPEDTLSLRVGAAEGQRLA